MKFMTLWTDDWIAGTHPLSPESRGVFITIVCHFINKDRVVKDDDVYLARLCNMSTRAYRRVKKQLISGDFMTVRDGHLWMERASLQWKKDQSFSETQAKKAKLKSRSKVGKSLETNETGSAGALPPLPLPQIEDTNVSSIKEISAKTSAKRSARGTRIPDGWMPSEQEREAARNEGFADAQIDRLGDCFRDYWIGVPGAKGTKRDWPATWRNYVRSDIAKRQAGGNGHAGGGGSAQNQVGGVAGATMRILARYERDGIE